MSDYRFLLKLREGEKPEFKSYTSTHDLPVLIDEQKNRIFLVDEEFKPNKHYIYVPKCDVNDWIRERLLKKNIATTLFIHDGLKYYRISMTKENASRRLLYQAPLYVQYENEEPKLFLEDFEACTLNPNIKEILDKKFFLTSRDVRRIQEERARKIFTESTINSEGTIAKMVIDFRNRYSGNELDIIQEQYLPKDLVDFAFPSHPEGGIAEGLVIKRPDTKINELFVNIPERYEKYRAYAIGKNGGSVKALERRLGIDRIYFVTRPDTGKDLYNTIFDL